MVRMHDNQFVEQRRLKMRYQQSIAGYEVLKNWNGRAYMVFAESEQHAVQWGELRGIPQYAIQYVRSECSFSDRTYDKINGLYFVGKWYNNQFIRNNDDFSEILEHHYPRWKQNVHIEPVELAEEPEVIPSRPSEIIEVCFYAA